MDGGASQHAADRSAEKRVEARLEYLFRGEMRRRFCPAGWSKYQSTLTQADYLKWSAKEGWESTLFVIIWGLWMCFFIGGIAGGKEAAGSVG